MNQSSCFYSEISDWLFRFPQCVLATVVQTSGSVPQKAGSSALIGPAGLISGTVGGGSTELKVIQYAQKLLQTQKSALFSFDLHGEIALGSESICGGCMAILLDASPHRYLDVFGQVKKDIELREKGVLLTLADASDFADVKLIRQWIRPDKVDADLGIRENIRPIVFEMLRNASAKATQTIPYNGIDSLAKGFTLAERILPKPQLFIAGAGHVGRALAYLGKFLDFSVTVWDDRDEFADATKIAGADVVLTGALDDHLDKLSLQDDTYIVIVTRGHKSDAEVLRKFIGSNAAYIGMIGSKAKVAKMKASFLEKEWATPEQWSRIYSPVGMAIGAQTVEEIAVSIAAELVKVRNQIPEKL